MSVLERSAIGQEDARPIIAAVPEQREQPSASVAGAYVAYVAICVIWGTTFLAIRVAVETIPPLVITAMARMPRFELNHPSR